MPKEQESRRSPRFTVYGIEGTIMFASEVNIIDISMSGIALRADRRLDIGREYTMKLEFDDKTFTIKGTVVWSVLSELTQGPFDEMVPVYKAGLRFAEILSDKVHDLVTFIERNRLIDDQRMAIRFDVRSPGKAVLDGIEDYKVKKVSTSGMLIETDMPLELEKRFPMEISLSDGKKVSFMGRVAFCLEIKDKIPKHFDVGIEFLEMPQEDKAVFREFIKSLPKPLS